jgi:type IV secretory pathway VirB4 component
MPELTTQQFLEIEEIKEGVLVLKDKSLRGILAVSSLNFALKSEEEQNAIIYQFQNFLNSLDFTIQIYVQSRRLNLTGYLEKLEELEKKQTNELLKIQTRSYIDFIKSLVGGGSIMTKNFYVVVPFHPVLVPGMKGKSPTLIDEEFQRAKTQLWQRMEFVAHGLRGCGLFCAPLNTQELIELFWSIYHPEEAEVGYYPEIPPELIK